MSQKCPFERAMLFSRGFNPGLIKPLYSEILIRVKCECVLREVGRRDSCFFSTVGSFCLIRSLNRLLKSVNCFMHNKSQIRFRTLRTQEALPNDIKVISLEVRVSSLRDVDLKVAAVTKGKEEIVLVEMLRVLDYLKSSQSKV